VERAIEDIKRQMYAAKRGFDQKKISTALSAASNAVQHLRVVKLSPAHYYDVWIEVTQALASIEGYFDELDALDTAGEAGGMSVMRLYEEVQHCGNILPRLYLLITVASTYIKSRKAPSKDVLSDLVELCRGVQHPMRGLFLRGYLAQMARDKLPDEGSPYNGYGGTVHDAVEFILQNFAEMNKLWVRMQHQGAQRDRAKRERERLKLRQLVGANLLNLANLQGLTVPLYKEILPRILEQIVNCKDVIAQDYLMDCIIQVFPDDMHLETLEIYLSACLMLRPGVALRDILTSLINRLTGFAKVLLQGSDAVAEILNASGKSAQEMLKPVFPLLAQYVSRIVNAHAATLPLADIIALQVELIRFTSTIFPDRLDYIDGVLEFAAAVLANTGTGNESAVPGAAGTGAVLDAKAVKLVTELLAVPLSALKLNFLQLTKYRAVLQYLERPERRQVAIRICTALLEARVKLSDVGTVNSLMQLLLPLLRDDPRDPESMAANMPRYDLEHEQTYIVRIFHMIECSDDQLDVQFKIYNDVRRVFGQGGVARLEFTLPPLVYACLRLAQRAHKREAALATSDETKSEEPEKTTEEPEDDGTGISPEALLAQQHKKKAAAAAANASASTAAVEGQTAIRASRIFQFIMDTIKVLVEPFPEIALRLFTASAYVADSCGHDSVAYEFGAQAIITYETELADSKVQFAALTFFIGALSKFKNIKPSNYSTLATKATQHSARLLDKPMQCRAVYNCAALFWNKDPNHPGRDDKKTLHCLSRALKIANSCMDGQVHLFVEILNRYIYYYDNGCPSIELKTLTQLVLVIDEKLEAAEESVSPHVLAHYKNTKAYLESKRYQLTEE